MTIKIKYEQLKFFLLCCFLIVFYQSAHSESYPYASETVLDLPVNQGRLIDLAEPFETVFISDANIVDYHTKSSTQIYLFAKKAGKTTFYATNHQGRVILKYNICSGEDLSSLNRTLKNLFPSSQVELKAIGESGVAMTGFAASAAEAENIRSTVNNALANPKQLVNLMNLKNSPEINLHVEVVEINRKLDRALGLNWLFKYTATSSGLGMNTTLIPDTFAINPLVDTFNLAGNLTRGNFSITSLLQLLEDHQLITILAEPNLTALSGSTASFLAGGEFPIVIPASVGSAPSVVYKQYGVSLTFAPTALPKSKINIQIKSEVSEVDRNNSVIIQGYTIPALTVRRAETTIELQSGQSFVIAGLLQSNSNKLFNQLPGIGNTPILGALFRSQQFQRQETELVIIVTPYFVHPVAKKAVNHPAMNLENEGPANRAAVNATEAHESKNIGFILEG